MSKRKSHERKHTTLRKQVSADPLPRRSRGIDGSPGEGPGAVRRQDLEAQAAQFRDNARKLRRTADEARHWAEEVERLQAHLLRVLEELRRCGPGAPSNSPEQPCSEAQVCSGPDSDRRPPD